MKWRDQELWEAKSHLIENQVRRLMRASDDPVLQEMALDDSMFMRFLGIMSRLIEEAIGRRAASKRFLPKNPAELMRMMEFIAQHQERILGKAERQAQDPKSGNVTFVDNRKLILKGKLEGLPSSLRQQVIQDMHGAVDQKRLAGVRKDVWEDDESTTG